MAEFALQVSPAARAAILEGSTDEHVIIRLTISERFEHDLSFAQPTADDVRIEMERLTVVLDPASAARGQGVSIDFGDGPQGPGFVVRNPNQPPRIVQISALELKAMRDQGDVFELVDVRTEDEREMALIDGSRLLDREYHRHLLGLDHDTPLVFQCHHGVRSQAAAEYFLQAGFKRLYNLRGGIDAWSQLVDLAVPRY